MSINSQVRRVFVVKRSGFDVEAMGLVADLRENLGVAELDSVRIFNRYDVDGINEEDFQLAIKQVFSETPVDDVFVEEAELSGDLIIAVEALPGQYDQRADSAAQCIQILTQGERPRCRTARIYCISGSIDLQQAEQIRAWLINPVEAREASLAKPLSLDDQLDTPEMIVEVDGLIRADDNELEQIRNKAGLAMSLADLKFIREYFSNEKRNPTWTELRVLDTYWSDHCRHTTFLTQIDDITFNNDDELSHHIHSVLEDYKQRRREIYGSRLPSKPICLMDLATIAMKKLRADGLLDDLDQSEEINACSIKIQVDVDDQIQDWLLMFKNETHNHPTEIEPFGGAATCLGGAIRDPLSGRSYVYQAMRVTGSGDPTVPVSDTIPGKLPQRKITRTAAHGYSSYGNQIGLATGQVDEIYHPGYVAKRMEIGAVIAAAPAEQVRREVPQPGDKVILLGGRTGRDGCGGATGSSKAHTEESLITCGSEVQKGNPPTERKIQRLFRNPDAARMIKRCNDFGAGGVSVAIGELAPGLRINLDLVPKKYEGLDGTELAISESQERMAVVVADEDVNKFISAADLENLEAVVVAEITQEQRMVMVWRGQTIVDLSREFIDSNGAPQHTSIIIESARLNNSFFKSKDLENLTSDDYEEVLLQRVGSLRHCSRKGLVEMFDSTIGAGTILMPFGGSHQLTAEEGMAALIPVLEGKTETCSFMAYGFDPDLSTWSPFHGAYYAVLHSLSRLAAMGADPFAARLTFQEYFERLTDKTKWGKPLMALLGAYQAQLDFSVAAIGGKDSMSGSFNDLHVPPTLVSFAVAAGKSENACSAVLSQAGLPVWLLDMRRNELDLPDICDWREKLGLITKLQKKGFVEAAATVDAGGVAVAITRQCFGEKIGFEFDTTLTMSDIFQARPGAVLLAVADVEGMNLLRQSGAVLIGRSIEDPEIVFGGRRVNLEVIIKRWQSGLEKIFPTKSNNEVEMFNELMLETAAEKNTPLKAPAQMPSRKAKPRVFIPVFPGTNCEYDTVKAYHQAGAETDVLVVRNLTSQAIQETLAEMTSRIAKAQIIMLPGGFSGGDEPEGSGKFIAAALRNPAVTEQIRNLLKNRDGLMLGICNGFQALIKLGLLPYGDICELDSNSPTLTFNHIGRHVSCYVTTKIVTNRSPWLSLTTPGDLYQIPVSHGEGRFSANSEVMKKLVAQDQIATQYVDFSGKPSAETRYNPNGSTAAIEGLISPDGRIFGKMGHSERVGNNLALNIPGKKDQQLFAAGVKWFE
ncbi:MAG: phosphoribosylformylglycinamidine synthase [Clostridiales bacterium]|nr:phosphoribosylformylglycinamidine synthase [Clostridiales bacterium]